MIKIISTDLKNKTVTLDLYLAVPTGTNDAGITWSAAVSIDSSIATETIGEIEYIKQRQTFRFSSVELTNAQRLAELTAYHSEAKAALTSDLADKLKFTGYTIAD